MAHSSSLVAAEIVHDDDVVWSQGWDEDLLDIEPELFAIDRPGEQPWRLDAIVSQGGEEGHPGSPSVGDRPSGPAPHSPYPGTAEPRQSPCLPRSHTASPPGGRTFLHSRQPRPPAHANPSRTVSPSMLASLLQPAS